MKVFTCKDFSGHWPVGTSAVVIAESEDKARYLLIEKLSSIGLPQSKKITLEELDITQDKVEILQDGDY